MLKVLSNQEMKALDNKTIQDIGIPGIVLMERAASGCVNALMEKIKPATHPLVYIFAGKGNNGGDGLAMARYLSEAGYCVQVFSTIPPKEYKGEAAINGKILKKMEIPWYHLETEEQLNKLPKPAAIVDALYGTGFTGALADLDFKIASFINHSGAFVMSVDIPSGINGNVPAVAGECVRADLTVTIAAIKRAHLFYPARFYVGELQITDIGIPIKELTRKEYTIQMVEQSDIKLPPRIENAHKYKFGRILIIAGSYGMVGAAVMAARAASLIGGGMVHLAVPEAIYPMAESQLLGEIVVPLADRDAGILNNAAENHLVDEIHWADCILIGPGIGREPETVDFIKSMLERITKPVVIDADALSALTFDDLSKYKNRQWMVTPHHGEFSRISWYDAKEIEDNPVELALEFSNKSGLILNLKNAPSLVATPSGQMFINSSGNAALAKGGTGDVLAGMIIGLIGQKMDPDKAAYTANYLHGYAADLYAANYGASSLTPQSLLEYVPQYLKQF